MCRSVVCLLSLAIAVYALCTYGLLPVGAQVHPEMRAAFEARTELVLWHVFAASVALLLGPFQFSSRFRQRAPAIHRWAGRLYLGIGVLVGGISGLCLAVGAHGGILSRLGFSALAVSWLYSGLRAWLAIRHGDVAAHRSWMVLNFSLSFAAVTLRMYVPIAVVSGFPFDVAYSAISWLCWVPNLLVARWLTGGALR